jgi:hypothetical protein
VRYRESLFRFLEQDGIPWNNNTAKRAIRHLAVQRKISGALNWRGAVDYLEWNCPDMSVPGEVVFKVSFVGGD